MNLFDPLRLWSMNPSGTFFPPFDPTQIMMTGGSATQSEFTGLYPPIGGGSAIMANQRR